MMCVLTEKVPRKDTFYIYCQLLTAIKWNMGIGV